MEYALSGLYTFLLFPNSFRKAYLIYNILNSPINWPFSSFGGPLIILLLLLTLWPCLLNKLVAFIKSCIKAVQLMVRRSQYAALPMVPLAGDNIELTPDP